MSEIKTMTKAQEIELLQRFITESRNAPYLYDALIALSVPFENAVRSDFPGKLAASDLLDQARSAREEIQELQQTKFRLNKEISDLRKKEERNKFLIEESNRQLEKLQSLAHQVANYCAAR